MSCVYKAPKLNVGSKLYVDILKLETLNMCFEPFKSNYDPDTLLI
jgi:hypothetical protein